jgi:hypothetical protein
LLKVRRHHKNMKNKQQHYKLYGIPYLGSLVVEFLIEEENIKYEVTFPTSEKRNCERIHTC